MDKKSERLQAAIDLMNKAFDNAVEAWKITKEEMTRPLTKDEIRERDEEGL